MAETLPEMSTTSGFVEIHGCQFYYQVAGEGHPLVLLHAGICDSRMWDDQWSAFARQHRVVRFDMRGFGRSSPSASPFTPHEDLQGLLQFLGIRKTYLLGASMGGQVALDFTLAQPEMVDALILVGSALTDRRPSDALLRSWAQIGEALQAGDTAAANEIELSLWVDGPRRSPDEVDHAVRARVREMNAVKFAKHNLDGQPRGLEPPAAQRLAEIQVPTLVIAGDQDHPEILDGARRLADGIPGAQHLVMAGTAHLPSMEQPAPFNRAVQTFLEPLDHGT